MSGRISFYILLNLFVFGSCQIRYEISDEWMKDAEPISRHEIDKKADEILTKIDALTRSIGKIEREILNLKIGTSPTGTQNSTDGTSVNVAGNQTLPTDDVQSTTKDPVLEVSRLEREKEHHEEEVRQLRESYKKLPAEINNFKEGINRKNRITIDTNNVAVSIEVPYNKAIVMVEDKNMTSGNCDDEFIESKPPTKVYVHQNLLTLFPLERKNFTAEPMYVRSSVDCRDQYEFENGKLVLADHDGSWDQSRYRVYANNTVLIKEFAQFTPEGTPEVIREVIDKIQNDVFLRICSTYTRSPTGWAVGPQTAQSINLNDTQTVMNLNKPCQDSLTIRRYTEKGDFLSKKILVCNKD